LIEQVSTDLYGLIEQFQNHEDICARIEALLSDPEETLIKFRGRHMTFEIKGVPPRRSLAGGVAQRYSASHSKN
jgi:hypothetical protein